jgi:CheY-like chemotaxis protein
MANMSHELRTPLNSILLLSRLLLENKEKTLTVRQAEFTRTIHLAGEDLLNLINEILDLAKVEAGKMEITLAPMRVRSMAEAMRVNFAPLAEQRGLAFSIHVAPEVPAQLISDRKRIEQIIKNFLSNAFKFTARGTIRLQIAVSHEAAICRRVANGHTGGCLAVSVTDTGIGIPESQHEMVFEAFQQVDGSIRRKYGGTGLGLSISRELAHLLGGEITLESQSGQGSRFTLHLPIVRQAARATAVFPNDGAGTASLPTTPAPIRTEKASAPAGMDTVSDDRRQLTPGEASVLIIAADSRSLEPIKDHAYREGYKVLVAEQLQTGLHFADYYLPTAIFADLQLPGENGWMMIHRIKADPNSRHIPVFTLSTRSDAFTAALHGAAGHVIQPVNAGGLHSAFEQIGNWRASNDRTVLVMGPAPRYSTHIGDIVGDRPIRCIAAPDAMGAGTALNAQAMHAVIVNPATPGSELNRFLTALRHDPIPVLLFSTVPAPDAVQAILGRYALTVNLKPVDTSDQLLAALAAHLHLSPDAWDDTRRRRLQTFDNRRSVLKGRKVLLVDDDMRTVFAVSSVLEDQGTDVLAGKTGKESLDKLDGFPDIDLVLMDVMIANVNGYQAIREIRRRDHYKALPIIALTAKAMQGDRARCIAAGADDYLAKPVNLDKLTSMLRIWLDPQRTMPEETGAYHE